MLYYNCHEYRNTRGIKGNTPGVPTESWSQFSFFLSFIKAYVRTECFARRADFPATDVTDRLVPFCLLLA